jgi:hypothetical protein
MSRIMKLVLLACLAFFAISCKSSDSSAVKSTQVEDFNPQPASVSCPTHMVAEGNKCLCLDQKCGVNCAETECFLDPDKQTEPLMASKFCQVNEVPNPFGPDCSCAEGRCGADCSRTNCQVTKGLVDFKSLSCPRNWVANQDASGCECAPGRCGVGCKNDQCPFTQVAGTSGAKASIDCGTEMRLNKAGTHCIPRLPLAFSCPENWTLNKQMSGCICAPGHTGVDCSNTKSTFKPVAAADQAKATIACPTTMRTNAERNGCLPR